ncbi:MAG: septation protein SpoVG family protein [Planctomycetaceae bacterium]|nr:septation protein SpoVG family protein [Planctomycetaceae bacterium]
MEITEVRVTPLNDRSKVVAYASITIDRMFVVKDNGGSPDYRPVLNPAGVDVKIWNPSEM